MDLSSIHAIVLHFRAVDQTLRCLRSLRMEGIGRLVLVDNSEDAGRSVACMRVQLEALRASGLGVDLVTPSRNLGFAKAVNLGLGRALAAGASGVLLVNSDAQLEPGALLSLSRASRDTVTLPLARSRPNAPARSLLGYYQCAFALVLQKRGSGSVQYPSGCCLLFHADVVRPNLFDEDFFFYGEDVVLGRTLRSQGVRIVECPEAVIVHAGSASARNGTIFYEYHINRGHWLLASKLASNRLQRTAYIACRCASLPLRATVRALRFRSLTPWRGLVAATLDVMKGRRRSFTPPVS